MIASLRRVWGLMYRHLALYRRSWPRLLELAYWPTLQMCIWGFTASFFAARLGNPGAVVMGGDIRKKNPYTGASGAIQILPKMARRLGLAKNHHLQPLSEQVGNAAKYYVEQLNYFDFPATPADFYLLCFYPSAVNKGFGYKVGGSKVAAQNKILDLNKDGQILRGEIVKYFNSFK